jgi:tRNA-2-methylthio-N6-dimethylallyladenosine synthase
LSLIREVGFESAFAFTYSPRPGTPALRLDGQVPEEVKSERLARLLELVARQQGRHLRGLVGTRARVLLEGRNDRDRARFSGRSERAEIVHVRVPPRGDYTGQLAEAIIDGANKHSLMGSLVSSGDNGARAKKETVHPASPRAHR